MPQKRPTTNLPLVDTHFFYAVSSHQHCPIDRCYWDSVGYLLQSLPVKAAWRPMDPRRLSGDSDAERPLRESKMVIAGTSPRC